MSKFNGELIRAFADADMNISRTADTMHITCRTVMNRLDKIKQNTGLNPRRFWDLIKLLVTAEKLEKSPEAYSIIYNGYLLQQSNVNWDYMIFDMRTDRCVMHAPYSVRLTDKAAKAIINKYMALNTMLESEAGR